MKQKLHWLRTLSTGTFLTLIVLTCSMPGRAQTVIPQVCIQSNPQTTTVTLGSPAAAGANTLPMSLQTDWASLIVNPGGATEERIPVARNVNASFTPLGPQGAQTQLLYAHSAGETVLIINELDVVFGYTNPGNVPVDFPRGVSFHNYFLPGSLVYSAQITHFLPGVHSNAFKIKFGTDIPAGFYWFLDTTKLTVSTATPRCGGTTTYQGRLSEAGTTANGNYDLQFEAYDSLTGGTPQTDRITVSNVPVTNGIFTVPLNFTNGLTNTTGARFFEIGVRPSGGSDAFSILAPRQQITEVPLATNAKNAITAALAVNAMQLGGIAADLYVKNNGSSYIKGGLQTTGDISVGQNLTVTGIITSSCRTGFTPFASGRLCVSAMQAAATFHGAIQNCKGMQARVGGSSDLMLTFSNSGFDYFNGVAQGWLADHYSDNTWGTWLLGSSQSDFDGPGLDVYIGGSGGTAPSLSYRCVY